MQGADLATGPGWSPTGAESIVVFGFRSFLENNPLEAQIRSEPQSSAVDKLSSGRQDSL
jgi:hypothetical protein